MTKKSILVVEDDLDIQDLICFNLLKEGYQVRTVGSGEDGLREARAQPPDLILLDLMLPGVDGLEVCRLLRREEIGENILIMMLTAKGEEADVVAGLELGADDYLTKPFSPRVLIARIRALLRRNSRSNSSGETPLVRHNLSIHPGRREVLVDGAAIELTYSEFQILYVLASRPGWVFTRNQIVEAVRGDDYPVTDRAVDVQIVGLRKNLAEAGKLIETVRGVGYRFKEV